MSLAPLLLAVVGDLAIFRIYFELFSVTVGTSPALTLRSAADGLLWTIGRTKKTTLAVETAAVLGHDDSSETLQDESLRDNQMTSGVQILEAYLEFLLAPRAYVRMEPGPGERFEVDSGHFDTLCYQGHVRKLYAFCLVECHSRKLYLEFTHSQSFETFVRCHIHAFRHMGGLTLLAPDGPSSICERLFVRRILVGAVGIEQNALTLYTTGSLHQKSSVWLLISAFPALKFLLPTFLPTRSLLTVCAAMHYAFRLVGCTSTPQYQAQKLSTIPSSCTRRAFTAGS